MPAYPMALPLSRFQSVGLSFHPDNVPALKPFLGMNAYTMVLPLKHFPALGATLTSAQFVSTRSSPLTFVEHKLSALRLWE